MTTRMAITAATYLSLNFTFYSHFFSPSVLPVHPAVTRLILSLSGDQQYIYHHSPTQLHPHPTPEDQTRYVGSESSLGFHYSISAQPWLHVTLTWKCLKLSMPRPNPG